MSYVLCLMSYPYMLSSLASPSHPLFLLLLDSLFGEKQIYSVSLCGFGKGLYCCVAWTNKNIPKGGRGGRREVQLLITTNHTNGA